MPTSKVKPSNVTQKKPCGHTSRATSYKRQAPDDTESLSSSDERKRSQKRQRRKGKGKGKKPQPIPEVIIEESTSEDSNEPNPINVDASGPESNAEHERDSVRSSCVTSHIPVDGVRQGSDLEVHKAPIGEVVTTKGETTKDLDLMFLKKGTVNFKTNGKDNKVKGRWCITCK